MDKSPDSPTAIDQNILARDKTGGLPIVSQTMSFISSLDFTFRNGLPQEKLVAVRQCVQRIWIDKENEKLQIDIYSVPASNIKIAESIKAELTVKV